MRRERLRLRDWMLFWILVLANVALVCAIFGNIDVNTLKPVSVVNEEQRSAEQQLVTGLKNQITSLTDELATAKLGAAEAQTDLVVPCLSTTSTTIDTYFTYVNKSARVSASLPYSFSWGSSCSPAAEKDGSIIFGPGYPDAPSWHFRDSMLSVLGKENTLTNVKQILQPGYPGVSDNMEIRERTISGMPVLSFNADGGGRVWYAFGRSNTYWISSRGAWLTDAEAIKIIQSLRVTN